MINHNFKEYEKRQKNSEQDLSQQSSTAQADIISLQERLKILEQSSLENEQKIHTVREEIRKLLNSATTEEENQLNKTKG